MYVHVLILKSIGNTSPFLSFLDPPYFTLPFRFLFFLLFRSSAPPPPFSCVISIYLPLLFTSVLNILFLVFLLFLLLFHLRLVFFLGPSSTAYLQTRTVVGLLFISRRGKFRRTRTIGGMNLRRKTTTRRRKRKERRMGDEERGRVKAGSICLDSASSAMIRRQPSCVL